MVKYIFFLFIVIPFFLSAQPENIMIGDSLLPEEPSIYINPKDPSIMMAGCNIYSVYQSQDSGYTWTRQSLTSDWGVWGDFCISADTAGNFLALHLANPPQGQGTWIDRIVFQKFDIGLQTWTTDTFMGLNGTKAQDKEWIAVDPNNNNMYVTWTQFDNYGSSNPLDSSLIMFSRSIDGGKSWSPAIRLSEASGNCIDSDSTVEGAVPAVGPNGEVYVSWAGPDGLVFDRSLDSGITWLDEDVFVDAMPGGWDMDIEGISRANGLPITKCDVSGGENHGTIYVNWADQRHGSHNTDIWLSKSIDGGNVWSNPTRVNDDTTETQQFFTWMDIDQETGYLYFIFYDRRAYFDERTDVYIAISKDGGNSFTNHKISESPFTPVNTIFFGDYNNIAVSDGLVRPIWTRLDNGQLSIWTAIINTELEEPEFNDTYEDALVYPNPSDSKVYFSFKLKEKSIVHLNVVDNQGKIVSNLLNNREFDLGMYVEEFDGSQYNLSNGIYYFVLETSKGQTTRKFIFNQ